MLSFLWKNLDSSNKTTTVTTVRKVSANLNYNLLKALSHPSHSICAQVLALASRQTSLTCCSLAWLPHEEVLKNKINWWHCAVSFTTVKFDHAFWFLFSVSWPRKGICCWNPPVDILYEIMGFLLAESLSLVVDLFIRPLQCKTIRMVQVVLFSHLA